MHRTNTHVLRQRFSGGARRREARRPLDARPAGCDRSPGVTVRLGAMSRPAARRPPPARYRAFGLRQIARCHGETRRNVAPGGSSRRLASLAAENRWAYEAYASVSCLTR
jgi:hypothetical protein